MKIAIFIDCQNDFLKGGKLAYCYPENDNFENVINLAKQCVENGYICLATLDTHIATQYDDQKNPVDGYLTTLEGKNLPIEHCIVDTFGWKMNEDLHKVLDGHCTYLRKSTFGSRMMIHRIAEAARTKGVEEILICGYCTSICVLSNAVLLRARLPNTKITVVESCCGDVSKESHEAAITTLKMQQIDVVNNVTLEKQNQKIFEVEFIDNSHHYTNSFGFTMAASIEEAENNVIKYFENLNRYPEGITVKTITEWYEGLPGRNLPCTLL